MHPQAEHELAVVEDAARELEVRESLSLLLADVNGGAYPNAPITASPSYALRCVLSRADRRARWGSQELSGGYLAAPMGSRHCSSTGRTVNSLGEIASCPRTGPERLGRKRSTAVRWIFGRSIG